MTVFTIGYEGLNIDEFLMLLRKHDIETLVDIRELPLSRKPGFSKKALAGAVNSQGLDYLHMVQLGCPRNVRDQYRADGSWKRYTDGFMKYLKTQDEAIAELSDLVNSSNCALLCYEADHNFCHRSMVANAVQALAGTQISHIKKPTALFKTKTTAQVREFFA
ncbi:hypothetical protein HFRIS_020080 [Herbaspirillum frisingense GSF30]|uniref:DUF488 domain-containing protein n=1 Tax=Herbaspirillum frisingense GSF30 TaxID=864073 RepID=A0AAI9N210_9BURK|nr:DUF488 domain-containing protein [Herbaspirillum frisingense]EOA02946.1 hypothetical protein HFRIS_020080 [Herbaspirillum frisingense GSF30]